MTQSSPTRIEFVADTVRGPMIGSCIYCGACESLSDEHVIPLALGGRFVLPRASCPACAAITSAFERRVLRGFLHEARTVAGFPTRRPKQRPATFELEVRRSADDPSAFTSELVAIDKYPAIVELPLLEPPSYVTSGRPTTGVQVCGSETIAFGTMPDAAAAALGAKAIRKTIDWDVTSFARLLAKIGYGFAVAEVGLPPRHQVPPLPLILGTADDASTWLGSDTFRLSIEERRPTHAVGLSWRPDPWSAEHRLLVASVKLFADADATGYVVVVWRSARDPREIGG